MEGEYFSNWSLSKVIRQIKNYIPWKTRLQLQLLLTQYPKIRTILQAKRSISDYNRDYLSFLEDMDSKTVCELGPGQYLIHAAVCYQMRAIKQYLIHIDDLAGYEKVISDGERNAMELEDGDERKVRFLPPIEKDMRWKDYLRILGADYYMDSFEEYKRVPDG